MGRVGGPRMLLTAATVLEGGAVSVDKRQGIGKASNGVRVGLAATGLQVLNGAHAQARALGQRGLCEVCTAAEIAKQDAERGSANSAEGSASATRLAATLRVKFVGLSFAEARFAPRFRRRERVGSCAEKR